METVLYVMCSQHYSGAEIVMARLIRANRDRVRSVVLCPPGEYADRLRAYGFELVDEPALGALDRGRRTYTRAALARRVIAKSGQITRRVVDMIRTERPAVVHANNLAAAVYLLPTRSLARIAFPRVHWIWSNHDLAYPHGTSSVRLARLCHRQYDRTIAVSNAVRERYRKYVDRIEVLYNGLNPEDFVFDHDARARFRRAQQIGDDTVAIGIVGTIEEGKGQHLLVEAFGALSSRFPEAILLIIGPTGTSDARYEERLRAMVDRCGGGRVRFTGRLDAIREVYCGLDLVVNATTSTRGEPLGTTIYEAMACERLVIATQTGGSPEIIDDGVDGFLCAPDSAPALAERLAWIIEHRAELDPVRSAARATVLHRFTVDRMRNEYNAILARLGERVPVRSSPPTPRVLAADE